MSQHAASSLSAAHNVGEGANAALFLAAGRSVRHLFLSPAHTAGAFCQSPSTRHQRCRSVGSFHSAFLPYFIPSHLLMRVKLFKCGFCFGGGVGWGRTRARAHARSEMPLSSSSSSFFLPPHPPPSSFILKYRNHLQGNYRPREGRSFAY